MYDDDCHQSESNIKDNTAEWAAFSTKKTQENEARNFNTFFMSLSPCSQPTPVEKGALAAMFISTYKAGIPLVVELDMKLV